MDVSCVRPDLSDLLFVLYSRPLHPELFGVFREQRVQRDDYQATLRITDTCHMVSWRCEDLCLRELVTTVDNPLP